MSYFFSLLGDNELNVLVSGDSTMAAFACRTNSIAQNLFSTQEQLLGKSAFSIAVSGNTINQQFTAYNNLNEGSKKTADFTLVQVGLNDCVAGNSSQSIADLQNYVNIINNSKKSGSKIILSCMLPCKYRWTYLNDSGILPNNPTLSQQVWVDLNKAIMNQNTSLANITGVDYRNNYHVGLMDDGNGNLKTELDCGDYIHENQTGANIMITGYRNIILS